MKRVILLVSLCIVFVLGLSPASRAQGDLPRSVSIGTHPVGSLFQVVGVGIATVASKHTPMLVKVKPVAGPNAFLPMMKTGEVSFGLMNSADARYAYTGTMYYKGKHPSLRLAQLGFVTLYGVVARKDTGVTRMQELKGKVVAGVFSSHPAARIFAAACLANAGLTWKDFSRVVPVATYPEAINALIEGRVQITALGAVGSAVINEADARVGVRILPVDPSPEAVKRMQEAAPGSVLGRAPRDYPGDVHKGEPFVGATTCLVTDASVPDDVVYAVVKALWNNYKELAPIHPKFKAWTPKVMIGTDASIPVHPGAIKFYKEVGAWTPELQKLQESLLALNK